MDIEQFDMEKFERLLEETRQLRTEINEMKSKPIAPPKPEPLTPNNENQPEFGSPWEALQHDRASKARQRVDPETLGYGNSWDALAAARTRGEIKPEDARQHKQTDRLYNVYDATLPPQASDSRIDKPRWTPKTSRDAWSEVANRRSSGAK